MRVPTLARRILRTTARLFISFCLGLATTIAIAWALACTDIVDNGVTSGQQLRPTRGEVVHRSMGGPADGIDVAVYRRRGAVIVESECYGPEFTPPFGIPGFNNLAEVPTPPDELVPPSLRPLALPWMHADPWPKSWDCEWREVAASGWPMLALASTRARAPDFSHTTRDAIELQGKRRVGSAIFRSADVPKLLPLRPLWLGLAIDTLLFATLCRGLLLLPSLIRRLLRPAWACPTCRYDRRGLVPNSPCPECGPTPSETPSANTAPTPARS